MRLKVSPLSRRLKPIMAPTLPVQPRRRQAPSAPVSSRKLLSTWHLLLFANCQTPRRNGAISLFSFFKFFQCCLPVTICPILSLTNYSFAVFLPVFQELILADCGVHCSKFFII